MQQLHTPPPNPTIEEIVAMNNPIGINVSSAIMESH